MSRWQDQSGANAVEFALLLPVLIVILFGTISAGMLYNQQLTLTQSAREGARFAATEPGAENGVCSAGDYGNPASWCHRVRARTINASSGFVGESNIDEIRYDEATGEVRVAVTRQGRLEIVMTDALTPTLTAESIARYER